MPPSGPGPFGSEHSQTNPRSLNTDEIMYTIAITLVVAGSLCYHVCNRSIDPRIAAPVSIAATYLFALIIVALPIAVEQRASRSAIASLGYVNWATGGLAVGVVLIELGYLLAYRAGGRVSTASICATTISSLLLVPIGVSVYGERVSVPHLLGIGLALIGIALINYG